MAAFMNKMELKNEVIKIKDELDKLAGGLMAKGCDDDTTGMLRAEVYSKMSKLNDFLSEMIYKIH